MNEKFKLDRNDYIEGIFKRQEEIRDMPKDLKVNLGGEYNIGILRDGETEEIVNFVVKLKLNIKAESTEEDDVIASMQTKHILYFSFEDNKVLLDIDQKINNKTLDQDENLENLIDDMINFGYIGIKEYIENSFAKAKIGIELPYSLV